jgi:hypothetical protein
VGVLDSGGHRCFEVQRRYFESAAKMLSANFQALALNDP